MADFTIDLDDDEQTGGGGPGHWLCSICYQWDGAHATVFHVSRSRGRSFLVDVVEIVGLDDEQAQAALDRRRGRPPPKT